MVKWTTIEAERYIGHQPTEFDKQGPLVSLGREPPQNVTDNALYTDKPVILRYSMRNVKSTEISEYLPNDWLVHATHADNAEICSWEDDYPELQEGLPDEIPVLLVEDYQTTGLVGDVKMCLPKKKGDPPEFPKDITDNTYFWFLRSLAQSTNKPGRGGSWGLGKLAIPMASSVRTFFTVTSRHKTKDRYLSGQAVLNSRQRFDTLYDPDMYFGTGDYYIEGKNYQWIPIENSDEIDNFCSSFKVTREQDQSGTSFVIPLPVKDNGKLNLMNLLICTVANYCIPILENKIVLEFSGPSGEIVQVNSKNIIDLIDGKTPVKIPWKDITKTINNGKMANPAHTDPKILNELIKLHREMNNPKKVFTIGTPNGKPNSPEQFNTILPEKDSEELEQIKNLFNKNEAVVFEGKLSVYKKGAGVSQGSYMFVIRKCDEEAAESHFYRDQLSIPLVRKKKPIANGVSSLLIVAGNENPLAEMLRQSEGPAHMTWEAQSKKLGHNYEKYGSSNIYFLRDIAEKMVNLITSVSYESKSIWDDIFSDRTKKKKKILEINRNLVIQEIEEGFIISKKNDPDMPILKGKEYLIRVGYPNPADVNPKSPPDPRAINVHDMLWKSSNATISKSVTSKDGGICVDRVKICIIDEDFSVELSGLNPKFKAQVITTEV